MVAVEPLWPGRDAPPMAKMTLLTVATAMPWRGWMRLGSVVQVLVARL
jgi:hypothetical protein